MSGIIPINSNILRSSKGRKTGKRLWQIAAIVEGENPIYDSVMKPRTNSIPDKVATHEVFLR